MSEMTEPAEPLLDTLRRAVDHYRAMYRYQPTEQVTVALPHWAHETGELRPIRDMAFVCAAEGCDWKMASA